MSNTSALTTADASSHLTWRVGDAPLGIGQWVATLDQDRTTLLGESGDYGGCSLTLARQGGADPDDQFAIATDEQGTPLVDLGGGSWSVVDGQLQITLAAGTTQEQLDALLTALTCAPDPTVSAGELGFLWSFTSADGLTTVTTDTVVEVLPNPTAGTGVDLDGDGNQSLLYVDFGPHQTWVVDGQPVAAQPSPLSQAQIALDAGIASMRIDVNGSADAVSVGLVWRLGMDSTDADSGQSLHDAVRVAYGQAIDPVAFSLVIDGQPVDLVASTVEAVGDNGAPCWSLRIDSADGSALDSATMQSVLRQVGVDYAETDPTALPAHADVLRWSVQVSADGSSWVGAADGQADTVQIGLTNEAPVLVAAFHQDAHINLHFQAPNWQGLDNLPNANGWYAGWGQPDPALFVVEVTVNGQTTQYGVQKVEMDRGVLLTLDQPIPPGAQVSVSYQAPGTDQASGVVQDWVGNDAPSGSVVSQAFAGLQLQALEGASHGLPGGMLNALAGYGSDDPAFAHLGQDGVVVAETDGTLTIEFRPATLVANASHDPEAASGLDSHAFMNAMLTVEIVKWDGMGWHQGDSVVLADLFSPEMGIQALSNTISWVVADSADGETSVLDFLRVNGADGQSFSLWASMNLATFWGNDAMAGSDQADTLQGYQGQDTIEGGAGNDSIDGGLGHDQLDGGAGHDVLVGGTGDDQLLGGSGNDTLVGGAGDDFIDGGVAHDHINYTDGNSLSYSGASAAVRIDLGGISGDGSRGYGTVEGSDASVGIDTVANVNFITASRYDDTIIGSAAEQFEMFTGGMGNDTINGGAISDPAANRINYSGAGAAVTVDLATGRADTQDDSAAGNSGHDLLININQVRGSAFADTLLGSDATAYTELYEGLQGDDVMDGRGGFDIVRFDAPVVTSNVVVDLAAGTADGAFSGHDSFTNIEGAFGTAFDDTLLGGAAANGLDYSSGAKKEVLRGGAGNDLIDGGGGFDRADYASSTNGIEVHLSWDADSGTLGGWAQDGLGGIDTLISIEQVRGSDFDDLIVGSDRDTKGVDGHYELLEGRAGNDTLNGGAGWDMADYGTARSGVVASLALGRASNDGYGQIDQLLNIEGLRGSALADKLSGSLRSGEYLEGGQGADTLDGGAGTDKLVGGAGDDSFIVETAGDLTVENAGEGTDTVRSAISWTLGANIERLQLASGTAAINGTGNTLANLLTGNSGANVLDGGAGADTLNGGSGDDTYVVDNAADVVGESASAGTDTVRAAASYTLGANLERLVLTGSAAINGTGNTLANALTGNAAANLLDGGLGADTLSGGDGNDIYVVDNAGDSVVETSPTGGVDQVRAGIDFTLGANLEQLVLTGSAAIDGIGNALANTITGNAGANLLDGGLGADTLSGGDGHDIYLVDNAADSVVETSASGGTDTVQASVSAVLTANVEVLTLLGSASINGTGNALANTITGNAGANTLDGGIGADTMSGGAGNDSYVVDQAGDQVVEGLNAGTDTVQSAISWTLGANLERLVLTGSAAVNGTGNTLTNTLMGNAAANVLDGGSGADTMSGGAGNDTYWVDNLADSVVELAGDGTDTVVSTLAAWTLGTTVENGRIASTGTASLTGNGTDNVLGAGAGSNVIDGLAGFDTADYGSATAGVSVNLALTSAQATGGSGSDTLRNIEGLLGSNFADKLSGHAAANLLSGGAGNDTLAGGGGHDTLLGGLGSDVFRFDTTPSASTNADRLSDFSVVDDSIQLENAVFTKLATTGVLAAAQFASNAAGVAMDANDYVVYDSDSGQLYYDADGNGASAAVLFATLTPGLVLTSNDFIIS